MLDYLFESSFFPPGISFATKRGEEITIRGRVPSSRQGEKISGESRMHATSVTVWLGNLVALSPVACGTILLNSLTEIGPDAIKKIKLFPSSLYPLSKTLILESIHQAGAP